MVARPGSLRGSLSRVDTLIRTRAEESSPSSILPGRPRLLSASAHRTLGLFPHSSRYLPGIRPYLHPHPCPSLHAARWRDVATYIYTYTLTRSRTYIFSMCICTYAHVYTYVYIYISIYCSFVSCSLSRSPISTPAPRPSIGLDPRLEIPAPQTRLSLAPSLPRSSRLLHRPNCRFPLSPGSPVFSFLPLNSPSKPPREHPWRVTTRPGTILGGPLQTDRWL